MSRKILALGVGEIVLALPVNRIDGEILKTLRDGDAGFPDLVKGDEDGG
ncbi:MAG TPA: hypothetical protein VMN36_00110 [Verrucomicrobiales bacterium]|nr:hypothetical protein [Verrucomicrobiales bacterium]